jgi:hypothetical protein
MLSIRHSSVALVAFLLVPVLLAAQEPLALEPVDDISQETKTEIKFTLKAKPADAPKLGFTVSKMRKSGLPVTVPKNLKLDVATGVFSWTPTPSQAGAYELTVTAKDAKGNEATAIVKVTVRERPITIDQGQIGKLLKQWHAEGTAAGNTGDYYDNRDRDHSPLNRGLYPQLDEVMYSPEERKANRDWAAQFVLQPQVTFGNSSTSAAVTTGGSNVRFYYTNPRGMGFLYEEYRGNNIYMYPAHHDHHPGHNGKPFYGDVYPANSPYLITSQGSSGSDQPFMRAVPFTLAAFHPEVKKKLIQNGLLMPTVQMILRITNKHLTDPKEYLTGKAHPPVFEGSWVNDTKMVMMAHEMKLDNIPPMIQLKVTDEDKATEGKDYFEAGKLEALCDTPAAIARVVRGPKQVRRMVVSAEESFDINKHPLKYHWVVLRGDPERIKIKPLNDAGSVVELLIGYHARRPVDGHHLKIESNRVDIGAFVHNGTYYSAPGFVCLHTLDNEARTYDDKGRLLEIGYGAGDADLSITNWNALFDTLKVNDKSLASQLWQKALTAEQRAAIIKVAEEYRPVEAELAAALEKSKQLAEARQKALAAFKTADDKKTAAQQANDKDPNDETLQAYKKAAAERTAADEMRSAAETVYQAALKDMDGKRKAAEGILTLKNGGLDRSVKELVEGALNQIKNNPGFAIAHLAQLVELEQRAFGDSKTRVAAARKHLVGLGIMKEAGDSFQLISIRDGAGPLQDRVSRFEQNMIERYNAEVLSALVYPKFLSASFRTNFIDARLTTAKSWRDVYRHDAKGNIIGWTRYDGQKVSQFDAAGCLILEKDAKGRAIKAQTVKYVIDDPKKAWISWVLKQTPGDQINYYEYDGDDDFLGKLKKQEPAEEKK